MRRTRFIPMVLAVVAVAFVAGGAALGAAATRTEPTVHGSGIIVETAADTNYCLQDGLVLGRTIFIGQCSTADDSRFTFTDGADGQNVIVDSNGKCLDSGDNKVGTVIQEQACTYGASQQFGFTVSGQIVLDPNGKKCVTAAKAAQDAAVFVDLCSDPRYVNVYELAK